MEISIAISQGMMLNKQSSGWGFETSWRSCVTVITMLQNAISVFQLATSPFKEFRCFLVSAKTRCWEKLSSGRWFRAPWCSCGVTVKTMLQNTISQTADSHIGMSNVISAGIVYYRDYVSNERVSMFRLLFARLCFWTNSRLDADLWRDDAHVTSL